MKISISAKKPIKPKKLQFKRVAPGYYQAHYPIKVDGIETLCEIEVNEVEGQSMWAYSIHAEEPGRGFSKTLSSNEDWFHTKKEAVESLKEIIESGGFKRTPWGYAAV